MIDFADWCWGDPAFDWAGVPGLEKALPKPFGDDPAWLSRLAFYRLLAPFYGMAHGLKIGQVEQVERHVRQARRQLFSS